MVPEYRVEDMVFEMEEEKIPVYQPPKPTGSGEDDEDAEGAKQENGDDGEDGEAHCSHIQQKDASPSLL